MSHLIEAFTVDSNNDELEEIDNVSFTSPNYLFCWLFYEALDAHDCHDGLNGLGIERVYSNDDLHTCRSRLLYYYGEYPEDIRERVEEYIAEKVEHYDSEDCDDEDSLLDDKSNEILLDFTTDNIGFIVGYILKFLDKLVDIDNHIKLKFT